MDTVPTRLGPFRESPNAVDPASASKTSWGIRRCSVTGVADFESLVQAIRGGRHPIDYWDFERQLVLGVLWDWGDIRLRIRAGLLTADSLDGAVHHGLAAEDSRAIHAVVPGPP
jgi:hypothetical protein